MVKVTLEFDTKEEAVKFLAGGKKVAAAEEDETDLTGGGEEPEEEVDHEMVASKVRELISEDKANKPKIEALLKKLAVATTTKIPKAKLKKFLADLQKIG